MYNDLEITELHFYFRQHLNLANSTEWIGFLAEVWKLQINNSVNMNNVQVNKEELDKIIQQCLSALHEECPLRLAVITGTGEERHNFPSAWGL